MLALWKDRRIKICVNCIVDALSCLVEKDARLAVAKDGKETLQHPPVYTPSSRLIYVLAVIIRITFFKTEVFL